MQKRYEMGIRSTPRRRRRRANRTRYKRDTVLWVGVIMLFYVLIFAGMGVFRDGISEGIIGIWKAILDLF